MSKKNSADYEQLYFNMKKDYDSLLEKNQNDLIKIRIREKTLNERIQQIQRQRQEQVIALKQEIEGLKQKLKNCFDPPNNRLAKNELESIDFKEVLAKKEQSYLQLQKMYKRQQEKSLKLKNQILELQRRFKQTQEKNKRQLQKMKAYQQEKDLLAGLQASRLKRQIEIIQTNNYKLRQQYQQSIIKIEEKHNIQLGQNKILLQHLRQSLQNQKKRFQNCEGCAQLNEQLQLQREMLKSVRMMLKFKEIQLQNLKK